MFRCWPIVGLRHESDCIRSNNSHRNRAGCCSASVVGKDIALGIGTGKRRLWIVRNDPLESMRSPPLRLGLVTAFTVTGSPSGSDPAFTRAEVGTVIGMACPVIRETDPGAGGRLTVRVAI